MLPGTKIDVLALLFTAAGMGCSGIGFDVSQNVPEEMVPGSPLGGVLPGIFSAPLRIDIQSQIQARSTGPARSVTLSSMQLWITQTAQPPGDTDDWSFVTQVDIYVESTRSGTALPRVRVASASNPGPSQTITFQPVAGVDLLPYVNEGSQMTATVQGTQPPDDVSFAGVAVFHVTF